MKVILFSALCFGACLASDNGKTRTPAMGWRSWNLYGENVNQDLIENIMEGMVSRDRLVDGVPTSLCDLGYCDVGLDDNWQLCGSYGDYGQYTFHEDDGTPVVNHELFPSFKAMTDKAHSLGLTAGWYGNNCICEEKHTDHDIFYQGDVDAMVQFGFDGVKLDGCGSQLDLQRYSDLINATGVAIEMENCHWGSAEPYEPTIDWCPWNFYRTSGDVRASYHSVMANLKTTYKYADTLLSRPGCWAYPDMLEIGCSNGPGGGEDPGLSDEEERTHFGAWAIISSPLIISMDINNLTVMDKSWPLISNKEVLAVNQAWFGHPGGPFFESKDTVILSSTNPAQLDSGAFKKYHADEVERMLQETDDVVVPTYTYLYKPMSTDGSKVAVFLMNSLEDTVDLELNFKDIPGFKGKDGVNVRCLWGQKDLGSYDSGMTIEDVKGHDGRMIMLSA